MKLKSSIINNDGSELSLEEPQEAVKAALNQELADYFENKKKKFKYLLLISAVLVSAGVLGLFTATIPSITLIGAGAAGVISAVGYLKFTDPSIEIKGVEKRYWSIHCIPQEESNIYYDASNVVDEKKFDLQKLEGVETLDKSKKKLEEGIKLPVVRNQDSNPEDELRETVDSFENVLTNTNSHRTRAPLIGKEDDVSKSINYLLDETGIDRKNESSKSSMQVELVDAKKNVKVMNDLESLAFSDNAEDELREVKSLSKKAADSLKESQQESIEKLNSEIESIGEMVSIRSFNFYCPSCVSDDVYSELEWSKQRDIWVCQTCEKEFDDEDNVIPKHKMKDELVERIWDSLWTEKDDEKRRIYERIEDKRDELETEEFNKKREEINRVGDKIKEIKSEIRGLEAEAEAAKQTVEKLGRLMQKYDRIGKQRRKKFKQEVEKENEKIQKEVKRTIRKQQAEDEKMIKKAEKEAKRKARLQKIEEQKRHREEMMMEARSQKLEENLTKAEMSQDERHRLEKIQEKTKGRTARMGAASPLVRFKEWSPLTSNKVER